jgi:hypothetical protein
MRENALLTTATAAAKTVRWAPSAEARDAATGTLENVALCDAPSVVRLNSARAMRELRERQNRSGVGFCVKTLEAAEEAETEGKLSEAEGLLDRVVEELRVVFQTNGYKERSASYAAAAKKPARGDEEEDDDEAEDLPVEIILMAHARLFLARVCYEQGKREKGAKNRRIGENYAAAAGRAPPKTGEDERVGEDDDAVVAEVAIARDRSGTEAKTNGEGKRRRDDAGDVDDAAKRLRREERSGGRDREEKRARREREKKSKKSKRAKTSKRAKKSKSSRRDRR